LSDKKKAMINKVTRILLIYCLWFFLPALTFAKEITVGNAKITMTLDYGAQVSITSLSINGQNVINGPDGIFTSVSVNGITYSSLYLKQIPILIKSGNNIQIRNIDYGNNSFTIKENWLFVVNGKTIKWTIERSCDKQVKADESSAPVFNFNSINTWEGVWRPGLVLSLQ
jgi:hypothetical protein